MLISASSGGTDVAGTVVDSGADWVAWRPTTPLAIGAHYRAVYNLIHAAVRFGGGRIRACVTAEHLTARNYGGAAGCVCRKRSRIPVKVRAQAEIDLALEDCPTASESRGFGWGDTAAVPCGSSSAPGIGADGHGCQLAQTKRGHAGLFSALFVMLALLAARRSRRHS